MNETSISIHIFEADTGKFLNTQKLVYKTKNSSYNEQPNVSHNNESNECQLFVLTSTNSFAMLNEENEEPDNLSNTLISPAFPSNYCSANETPSMQQMHHSSSVQTSGLHVANTLI